MATDGAGPMAVSEFIKTFAQIKLASFTIEQPQVLFLNDSAAVIHYRFTGKGTFMGQPMPSPVLASTAWANRGGKWVAVYHLETIPPPPPPAKK